MAEDNIILQDIKNRSGKGTEMNPFFEDIATRNAMTYDSRFNYTPVAFTGQTGVGESMFDDKGVPFSELDKIDEIRAQRQPWAYKASAGVARVATKAIAEIAKMPGVIGGIGAGAVGQIGDAISGEDNTDFMKTAFNNGWVKIIQQANEEVNDSVLPVYVKEAVKDGNLWDKITAIDFWATEGADGLGYVVSMLAPGALINKFGLGAKIFGVSKTAKMLESTEKAVGLMGKAGITAKNADLFTATVANTLFEAGAEAKGAMDSYVAQLDSRLELPEGDPNKITQKEYDELLKDESKIGANVFTANALILLGPNAIVSKMLWGKAGTRAASGIVKGGEFKAMAKPSFLRQVKLWGDDFGAAAVREGFWEEGMQSTAEQYFTQNPKNNLKDFGGDFANAYAEMLGTSSGQSAIFLGAAYGGGMQSYFSGKERGKERKVHNLLVNGGNNMMSQLYSIFGEDIFVKEDGKIIYEADENGKLVEKKDVKKIKEKLLSLDSVEALSLQYDMAVERNDKETIAQIKDIVITHVVKPFLVNDSLGIDALKEHLEQSEELTKIADREGVTKDTFISDIIQKATILKNKYNNFQDFAPGLIKLSAEEATNQDKVDFYNKLSMQYVDQHARQLFLKNELNKTKQNLDELLQNKGKSREDLESNKLFKQEFLLDGRAKKLYSNLQNLESSIEQADKTIEAFWDGKSANEYFQKEVAEKIKENKKKELIQKVEDKQKEIANAKNLEELEKIVNDIEDEGTHSVIEIDKENRRKELAVENSEKSREAKERGDNFDNEANQEAVKAEQEAKYIADNFNVGEIINVPGTEESAKVQEITEDGIKVITESGEELTIPTSSIFDNRSNYDANFSVEGNPDTNDKPAVSEVANAEKNNVIEDKNDASIITNQKWNDPAALEFERTPRDKRGEEKGFSINQGSEGAAVEAQDTSEVDNLDKEIKELNDILEYARKNKEVPKEETKKEEESVIEKAVEQEVITKEEEKVIVEESKILVEEIEKEESSTPAEKEIAKKITNAVKKNLVKDVIKQIFKLPSKFINKLSSKVKGILKRISNKIRKIFLGVTLITALVNGVRTDAGNKFVADNISEDIANVIDMSPSDIMGLVPNVIDKVFEIGTYADNTSTLDNLLEKGDFKPAIYPQLEEAYAEPIVEKESFLPSPIIFSKTVYRKGNKEVKPYVMDLNSGAVKIELATNTRSPKSKTNKEVKNAEGIMGATHRSFQPQSKTPVSNTKYPVSLVWNKVTKEVKFKVNKDIAKDDMVMPTNSDTFIAVDNLDIAPNESGGYSISTAKDNENGTTIIKTKNGGSFHIGLENGSKAGQKLESNNLKSYRNLRGGMVIFTSKDASVNIVVSGSPNDIFSTLRRLKETYPDKELFLFRGDTGTYSTSEFSDKDFVSIQDMKDYSARNTWGDNQLFILKKQDQNTSTSAVKSVQESIESSSPIFPFTAAMSVFGLVGFRKKYKSNQSFSEEEIQALENSIKIALEKRASLQKKFKAPSTKFTGNLKKALDMYNTRDFSDLEFLIKYLPINVKLTDTVEANLRTFSDNMAESSFNEQKPNYNDIWNKSDRWLRTAIIKEIAINKADISNITAPIAGQKSGTIQVPKVDNKIPEHAIFNLHEFGGDISNVKAEDIYVVNDLRKLENIKGDTLYANRPLAKGEAYIAIHTANGTPFPLKLNVKKIAREEAEVLYELYKYRFEDYIANSKSKRISAIPTEGTYQKVLDLFEKQLPLLNKDTADITIKDVTDFFIWDGTQNPKSQVRFYSDELLVGEDKFSQEDFNSEETKEKFIYTITNMKRHHIRFKKKGATDTVSSLEDRPYLEYLLQEKILNTNAVVNEPTFQGDTSIYLQKDNVKVNNQLSEFNKDAPKTYSSLLKGNNEKLSLIFPQLFKRPVTLTPSERYYIDEKGNKYTRASELKESKTKNAKGANVVNASVRGNTVDELTRIFFSDTIKRNDFIKLGNVITDKQNSNKKQSVIITDDYFNALYDILEEYAAEFDRLGLTIYSNVPTVSGKLGTKGLYAGTVDLLAYDNKEDKWIIIDLKTTTKDRGDYYDGTVEDVWGYKEGDRIQQNTYRELFKQKTGKDVSELWIMPLTSVGEDRANSVFSEISKNKSGMFLKIDMSKDIFELKNIKLTEEHRTGISLGKLNIEQPTGEPVDQATEENEGSLQKSE